MADTTRKWTSKPPDNARQASKGGASARLLRSGEYSDAEIIEIEHQFLAVFEQ